MITQRLVGRVLAGLVIAVVWPVVRGIEWWDDHYQRGNV